MTDSKVDKEAKSTDIEHKTAKKQDESRALTVKKEDHEGTQKELDAAEEKEEETILKKYMLRVYLAACKDL